MKIPVFVSRPTKLNTKQKKSLNIIFRQLEDLQLDPRSLGTSDYPDEFPLREVDVLARHCSGGIILGFEQYSAKNVIKGRGTKKQEEIKGPVLFPTPWNQVEAGIMFGLGLPLVIFREDGISGGVFDNGVTDVFVHKMPPSPLPVSDRSSLKEVFLKWHAKVLYHYYERSAF